MTSSPKLLVLGVSLALSVAGAGAAGCSSDSTSDASQPSTGADADAGEVFACAKDPRVTAYVADLQKTGRLGKATFTISAADPAPPRRGLNDWILKVADPSGAGLSISTIAISGVMPDHQHGWSTKPQLVPMGDGTTFTFNEINLFMAGVWEVTFDARTAADGGDDSTSVDTATFTFCVG